MTDQERNLEHLLEKFKDLTEDQKQLCEYFYQAGVNFILHKSNQVPVLFTKGKV